MIECGYTWEYVDTMMTIPRLAALQKRWKKVPPLGELVAAIAQVLGVEWGTPSQAAAKDDAAALAQAKAEALSLNAGGIR